MITSPQNKRVAQAVRLHKRALREKDRRFLVEGVQAVGEALASGAEVVEVFVAPLSEGEARRADGVLEQARTAGVPVNPVSTEIMSRLTSTVTPPGVVAVAGFVDVPLQDIRADARCIPVLAEVRDPGNAGAIIRSADAAGADAVVFTATSVDVYNEKAVRATAGSLFHLPVVRSARLQDAVSELRTRGFRILAASADGASSIYETDLTGPVAVLFGNEAHGLSEETRGLADETVRVPIVGRAESLNLAAAAALVLFESARQRSGGPTLAQIVAGSAHDIRSPLAALKGFTSTLQKRWDRVPDPMRLEMIEAMAFDAGRMGTLITFLLDAARLSSGQLKLAIVPMDLTALAAQVQADLSRPELVPIEVAGERLLVPVDGDRFRTILTALVEACRWWGEEGPVRIEVEPGPPVVVRVSRSKTALDRERARELFGPRPPGSGGGSKVGLFVANGLAKAHGGTLEVDADDRIEFVVTLPATPER
ncbi:MAG TPA: hypothetical protein DIU14_09830 [Actinobacteria bacterium]|jgi:TrmH family RNA methyltransferase|nr:hypothetical protein [Actinomycetota bacterium]